MTRISFSSNGYKLAGNLFVADDPKPLAFLFIQGWTGHQNIKAAQHLASLGYTCMTYDMRGHGDSEGNLADFSRHDFLDDAIVAFDYIKSTLAPAIKIGVVGSSFGSYTAALLSTERDVFCLSLRVPATYPDEGFDDSQLPQADSESLRQWRIQQTAPQENHASMALHTFDGSVQIIEAGADEIVPVQAPQNYAAAVTDKSKLTYDVMQGAPHRLASDELQAQYEKLLTDWITSLK